MSLRLLFAFVLITSGSSAAALTQCSESAYLDNTGVCNWVDAKSIEGTLDKDFLDNHPEELSRQDEFLKLMEKCSDNPCWEKLVDERTTAINKIKALDLQSQREPLISPVPAENPVAENEPAIANTDAVEMMAAEDLPMPSADASAPPAEATTTLPEAGIQSAEQATIKPASESDKLSSDMVTIVWLAVAAIGIGLLIAGASNKVVIYYNGKEMAVSFFAVALPITAVSMFNSVPFESSLFNWIFHWIVSPITGIIGIICFALNFQQAIKHNKNTVLGIFVGAFKIVFVFLTFIVVMGQISKMMDKKSSLKDTVMAAIVLAAAVAVARAMINGPETYEAKGWQPLLSPAT